MKITTLVVAGGVVIGAVVAAIAAFRAAESHINTTGANAIITVSSAATGEKVTLDGLAIDLLSGRGTLTNLRVPNSAAGKAPYSFVLDSVSLSIVPWSVLKGPLHIRSIEIRGPAIDLETNASGSNLTLILAAAAAYALASSGSPDAGEKLRIDELSITGGRLSATLYPFSTKVSTTVPDIVMRDMGRDGEGMSQADFVVKLLNETVNQATKAALSF